ncbi:PE family protein [Mycobacterium szulgai]|nr:PE family protein [Mycobacterium szulgai]
MSFVSATPEAAVAAANDLAGVGSAIGAANAAAATRVSRVLAAGADEVSAGVAALFAGHGQSYQAVSAQAAAFHDQFVRALAVGGGLYASAEAANVSPLQTFEQDVLAVINAPTEFALGRPLIG